MGFDLVVQHELQRGAGDLVIVDHENAPLVDSFRCFDPDLHFILLWFEQQAAHREAHGATSNFRSAEHGSQHYPENIDGSGGAIAPNG